MKNLIETGFLVKDREIEIYESDDKFDLSSDGSINFKTINRFERDFNCSLSHVMPYLKFNGSSWVTLRFVKD